MIVGAYDLSGPILYGEVYFPPPIDRRLADVAFVLDSGASTSCLMPGDVVRVPPEVAALAIQPQSPPLFGVGGSVPRSSTVVVISLRHEGGNRSFIQLRISAIMQSSAIGLPSLLGRDVLMLARVVLDPEAETVTFDLPPGSHDLLR